MAKHPLNSELVKAFSEYYYQTHTSDNPTDIIYNLIEDGLTHVDRIRNYMIVKEYPHVLRCHKGIAISATMELGEKYNITERQVQNIVYRWSPKFKKKNNVAGD